jgi:predicted permease
MSLRSPGFTLVAVLTLAIGIAANTTIFSWIEMMMLRPIKGVSGPGKLVMLETVGADGGPLPTSYADFRDYRDHLKEVSSLAAVIPAILNVGERDHAERVWAEMVSGNYFATLGVRPELGRGFSRDEYGDRSGAYPVAVIGHSLWKRRFNNDPRVIGATLLVNHQPLTVIGVAPREFHGSMPGLFLELWIPFVMEPQLGVMPEAVLTDRNTRAAMAIARLRPGVTLERARAECESLARSLAESNPRTNGGIGATVLPISKSHFGGQNMMEGPLLMLMAACGMIFVIVCANVASLLLARATGRRKEFSLRMAMGAGRGRIVRHLLAETLPLAAMGAVAGVLLAMWMSRALGYLMPRGANVPVAFDLSLNADILGFALFLCVMACLVSGLAPALHSARANLSEVLNEGGRGGSQGRGSHRLRSILVASEVALSLVAIVGAGLFAKSFQAAQRIDPGFDPHNVLLAQVDLSGARYSTPERRQFCERLRNRIASQPGVVSATWAETVPLWFTGNPLESIEVEGYVPAPSESMKINRNLVAPGYFDLMRIPLVEGRDFNGHDTEDTQRVAIVNQTFARHFFGDREPLGRRVHCFGEWYTVAGVARDIKYIKPTEAALPYFYVPFRQVFAGLSVTLHMRTAGDPELAAPAVRREVSALDPAVSVFDVMTMTESISAPLFGQKTAALLMSVMGLAALVLAATGLYSVMAYSVAQRTQEIGIRMALGAQTGDVIGLVLRRGMNLTLIGVSAGVAMALAVTRLMASLLIHVSATDPVVFIGATLFLGAVGLTANYLPARRATRIDPNQALRSQ